MTIWKCLLVKKIKIYINILKYFKCKKNCNHKKDIKINKYIEEIKDMKDPNNRKVKEINKYIKENQ